MPDSSKIIYSCIKMGLRLDDLCYFSIASFCEFMEDYIIINEQTLPENMRSNKYQVQYQGAEGLDKFLGG